ncbi:MAG: SdpI family protein [Micrococcales bacterium]|nr:SdpI family protein [Micrococcales bacterium]
MALWLTLLGTNLFVAGIVLGIGIFMTKAKLAYRPGGTQWVGYRTPMSEKNADTWEFANRYFGRKALPVGLVAVPATVIAMLPALPAFGRSETFVNSWGLVVTAVLVVALFVLVFVTERALRTTFTRQGTRRSGHPRPAAPTSRNRQATRRTRR